MKTSLKLATLAALLGTSSICHAQIRLALELEQSSCLQYEPIHAIVSVRNETDDAILIGDPKKPGYLALEFEIQQRKHHALPKRKTIPVVKDILIEAGETRKLAVELTRWYSATDMGRYLVRAYIRKDGPLVYSRMAMVDVVRGFELASATQRLSGYEAVYRTYSLRYWRRGRHEYLFLSVDEKPSGCNYGVFQLGRIIRFEKPTVTVSRDGKVEIRHQSGPDCYIRTKFDSRRDGMRFVDQSYELADGTPYPYLRPRVRGASGR